MPNGCTGSCMWHWNGQAYDQSMSNCSAGCVCPQPTFTPPPGFGSCWVPWLCSPPGGFIDEGASGDGFRCEIYHHKDYKPHLTQHKGAGASKKAATSPGKRVAPRKNRKK
jgi:hypothetical protein